MPFLAVPARLATSFLIVNGANRSMPCLGPFTLGGEGTRTPNAIVETLHTACVRKDPCLRWQGKKTPHSHAWRRVIFRVPESPRTRVCLLTAIIPGSLSVEGWKMYLFPASRSRKYPPKWLSLRLVGATRTRLENTFFLRFNILGGKSQHVGFASNHVCAAWSDPGNAPSRDRPAFDQTGDSSSSQGGGRGVWQNAVGMLFCCSACLESQNIVLLGGEFVSALGSLKAGPMCSQRKKSTGIVSATSCSPRGSKVRLCG